MVRPSGQESEMIRVDQFILAAVACITAVRLLGAA